MDKMEVNWAVELGLTVRELWMEHPGHPHQLRAKKRMLEKSELYWQKQALERLRAEEVNE
jgi:hypothetical protein